MSKSLVKITMNEENLATAKAKEFATPKAAYERTKTFEMGSTKRQLSGIDLNVDLETRSFSDLVSEVIRSTQHVDEQLHSCSQAMTHGPQSQYKTKHYLRIPETTHKFNFFNARFRT